MVKSTSTRSSEKIHPMTDERQAPDLASLSEKQRVFLADARKLSVAEAREQLAGFKDMRLRRWALMFTLAFDHDYTHASIARLAGITKSAARNALLGLNTKATSTDDAA